MNIIYENITNLCKENGITGGKMCIDLGMSKSTLTDLKMGRQMEISASKAQKIAEYFGVSVGYILGKEENQEGVLSAKQELFIQKVKKMTDEQIEKLEQIYELMVQK